MLFTALILLAAFAAIVYAIALYNNLIATSVACDSSWSNIDVALKQRHDEIPKLIAICQEQKNFERSTLERVIQARNSVHIAAASNNPVNLGLAENALRSGLGQLFAVAEAYPDLKANQVFLNTHTRISALEGLISDRRELYNESVRIFNSTARQFPASLFQFRTRDMLVFAQGDTADIDVANLFAGTCSSS